MAQQELMTEADVHAFGIEIVCKQLIKDDWNIQSADPDADLRSEPQIVAHKLGEVGFFIVRTGVFPNRGRFEEGQVAFETLVHHAKEHGASCYFAPVMIANAEGNTDEEMSIPVKGVGYNVEFNGLLKMELPN
jgi:hypothetical protein